jgi:hypothetical protein
VDSIPESERVSASWRLKLDFAAIMALSALGLSVLSFYRSYLYTKQQLDVTVTEVSYVTNAGDLYMNVAFSNGGNRDAAVLRVEPALWGHREPGASESWIPLSNRVHPDIPVTSPKMPAIIKAGGVEVVTLSAALDPDRAEASRVANGGAFLGIRVATMNSDGNLYLLEHAVVKLVIDAQGRIHSAEPAIHRSLSGFNDVEGGPPGDQLQTNKKTPFVWAAERF